MFAAYPQIGFYPYWWNAAASQMAQQMSQMNPGAGAAMFQPGQDPDKMFLSEAENLEVVEHEYILKGVEDRLLAMIWLSRHWKSSSCVSLDCSPDVQ